MYRLWSKFHSYWSLAKKADAPLLPRCVEFAHTEGEPENSKSVEEGKVKLLNSSLNKVGIC